MLNAENLYALDADVLERYKKLHTPLLSDTLERMGHWNRALDHRVQALVPNPHLKVVGLAYPCQVRATDQYIEIDNLLRMVDTIPSESVVVVAIDRENDCALWGGLMSTAAKRRQAVAAVVNGDVRDVEQITELGFPVFATGLNMRDIRGRGEMVQFGCPVEFGHLTIQPGDLIVGDANGVICIPRDLILPLLTACEEAMQNEDKTRSALYTGDTAVDVYERYQQF